MLREVYPHNENILKIYGLACEQVEKIEELTKERDILKIAFDTCITVKQIEIRDLEQQAKGLMDYANNEANGIVVVWLVSAAEKLLEQAKALKETNE
jgi:hypothetical protein